MKPIRQRRIRYLLSASLALAITGMAGGRALADAPDPKVPSQNPTYFRAPVATAHDNGDGTTTVTVVALTDPTTGVGAGWVWTTHHTDCNTNRAGIGFAVAWNDPQDPGFHVTQRDRQRRPPDARDEGLVDPGRHRQGGRRRHAEPVHAVAGRVRDRHARPQRRRDPRSGGELGPPQSRPGCQRGRYRTAERRHLAHLSHE